MSQSQGDIDPGNTIRCLVVTDNHLGYLERDPIRGEDSFKSFEEALQIARREKVDCILHAGDLFHNNKPSRKTLFKTCELLKKYCFGSGAVELELCTRAEDNFTLPQLNYMDPNLNVDLPIFAIHGNHDDPSGDGSFSAMDVLARVGLLNYFGKHAQVDELQLSPVLLKKGQSMLALYGFGNVRDERLHRAFAEKRVHVYQPKDLPDDVFSIMMLHQNRAQHSAKNYVSELMLPEFLDLVIWGHEHECLAHPQQTAGREFFVTQPGSSVATSLVEGEAKDKHVALLEINCGRFKLIPIPLTTVRPLIAEDINLSAENVSKDADAVHKLLANHVKGMIRKGLAKNANMLPLIRLRVDLSNDYEKIPPQRFGVDFVGKVANPMEILHYQKKRAKSEVTASNARSEAEILAARTAQAKQSVEDEVRRILSSKSKHMNALPERHLAEALHDFVEKEDSKAFQSFLEKSFKSIKVHVLEKAKETGTQVINADAVRVFSEERVKAEDAVEQHEEEEEEEQLELPVQEEEQQQDEPPPSPPPPTTRSRKRAKAVDDVVQHTKVEKKASPAKRAAHATSMMAASVNVDDDDLNKPLAFSRKKK